MSGLRPVELTEFYRSLHARGVTTADLARRLKVSGPVVRRLIVGLRRRGQLWERLQLLLTERECDMLAHVEQCSAWNNRPAVRRRAQWTAEKAAQLARRAAA